MPIRVKSRAPHGPEATRSPSPGGHVRFGACELPDIGHGDSFREVVKKLSVYMSRAVALPSTFEQLRTTSAGDSLRVLVDHLDRTCTNPATVNALLALKWHYGAAVEDKGVNDARACSCEIVAWRFLANLSEREAVDYCLYEIPANTTQPGRQSSDLETGSGRVELDENSPLLAQAWADSAELAHELAHRAVAGTGSAKRSQLMQSISRLTMSMTADSDGDGDGSEEEQREDDDPTAPFVNLNALEIAAIADAKRFLSQNVVQKIVTGIWNGDIIFWDNLSVHTVKKPRFYNPKRADPYSRLRVPKYLKSFEVVFFALFLVLYGVVLTEKPAGTDGITTAEGWLYIWIAAYLYDEMSEWVDAGSIFYVADVWNLFDVIMIFIGVMFAILRTIGLAQDDPDISDFAYDVLALEALFMVPRVCSILSLSPYWGTLIPCLKEMGRDFIKFMVLVVIVYLGFLTTFTLIGQEEFGRHRMTWILTKIFFGNSSVGFDVMEQIDPTFGPPLMIVFVTLSSILLTGSLTGMLSNSFSRVITHAREEYLYVYSVYVLEASTSNRLTHFYPPFNLLALAIFRPLRLFLPSDPGLRAARIALLKATHLPVVAVIRAYELARGRFHGRGGGGGAPTSSFSGFKGPVGVGGGGGGGGGGGPSGTTSNSSTIIGSGGGGGSGKTQLQNRRRWSSARRRPSSSPWSPSPPQTHDHHHHHRSRSSRRETAAEEEEQEQDAVEVRLADMAAKIDRLTDLVARLAGQATLAGGGDVATS